METEKSLDFTETEKKIRKKWLFWVVKLPIFVIVLFVILFTFLSILKANFLAITITALFSLIFFGAVYLNYYCAYKNPGTILLLIEIIALPLNIFATLSDEKYLSFMKASLSFSLIVLIMIFYQLLVLYYSYQLRKVNKNIHERKLIHSPVYMKALSLFSKATHLDELDAQFIQLRNAPESEGAVELLVKAYGQQKKVLKRISNRLT